MGVIMSIWLSSMPCLTCKGSVDGGYVIHLVQKYEHIELMISSNVDPLTIYPHIPFGNYDYITHFCNA